MWDNKMHWKFDVKPFYKFKLEFDLIWQIQIDALKTFQDLQIPVKDAKTYKEANAEGDQNPKPHIRSKKGNNEVEKSNSESIQSNMLTYLAGFILVGTLGHKMEKTVESQTIFMLPAPFFVPQFTACVLKLRLNK